jgi:ADP-ribose pyrophosphatase
MEKTLSSKIIYQGKILEMRVDRVSLPSGDSSTREFVRHPGAVSILPFLDDKKVILVRQFRYPVGEPLLEIPAGRLEPGENPEETARREMIEEIGYIAGDLKLVSTFFTTPGYTNEVMYLFFAYDLKKTVANFFAYDLKKTVAKPEKDEVLESEILSLEETLIRVDKGEIKDGKTIAALALASLKR